MLTRFLVSTVLIASACTLHADSTGAAGKQLQHGKASWYHEPQRVASGGRFNPDAMTAAHRTLPFGTMVRVTNLNSKRSAVVKINDRGPYRRGRIIDLSRAAARELAMLGSGVAPVTVEVLGL